MMDKINNENLESVNGGAAANDAIHDLSRFIQRTVCNVIHYDDTACLTLRRTPNGEIIPGIGWQNGDPILVHGQYSEDGVYYDDGSYEDDGVYYDEAVYEDENQPE